MLVQCGPGAAAGRAVQGVVLEPDGTIAVPDAPVEIRTDVLDALTGWREWLAVP